MYYNNLKVFRILIILSLCILITACPKNNDTLTPEEENPFKYGSFTNYEVNSTSFFELNDSVSGGKFVFPDGGSGKLKIARIISSRKEILPEGGFGFYIEYTGTEKLLLGFPRSSTSEPCISIYAKPLFSTYEALTDEATWISIAPNDTTSSTALFEIYLPGDNPNFKIAQNLKKDNFQTDERKYFIYYRDELKVNASWKRIEVLRDISKNMLKDLIDVLPDNVRTEVQKEVNGRLALKAFRPGILNSGYIPWWYLRIVNPLVHPYIMYRTVMATDYATESTAAHELGHYISHCVLGDDLYYKLTEQSLKVHDLGIAQAGRYMIEEWSHFSDYYLNIKIGRTGINKSGYDIEEMNTLFKNKQSEKYKKPTESFNPKSLDWPSLEGFATGVMSRLHSSKTTIESHTESDGSAPKEEDIPTLGLTHNQIYEILCKKPMNVDELQKEITSYFKSQDELNKFVIIAERCGWSYNGKYQVKLADGTLVKNGKATVFMKAGNKEYSMPEAEIKDGNLILERIFPSEDCSLHIEVNYGGCIESSKEDFVFKLKNFKTSLPTNKPLDSDILILKGKPEIKPLNGIVEWLGFYYDPSSCNNCWGVRNTERIPFSLGGRINLHVTDNTVTIGPDGRDLLNYESISGGGTVEVNKFFTDCSTDPKYIWNLTLMYKHNHGITTQPPTEFILEATIKSEPHKKPRLKGTINYKQFQYDSNGKQSVVCKCSVDIDKEINIP